MASLEKVSEHPLAEAIVRYAQKHGTDFYDIEHFKAIPGYGVSAEHEGITYILGNRALMMRSGVEITAHEKDVDKIVEGIYRTSRTGEIGDGKIFVYPVDNAMRIRTGEKGDSAL